MKSIRSLLGAIALFGCATLAVNAQSVNPSDPHFLFPNQVQAQTSTPPPAAATAAPAAHVTVSAQPTDPVTQVIQGIEAALLALLTGFAIPALNKVRTGADGKPATANVGTIVSSIFHPNGTSIIGDPATRAAVDAALLQIVQSGVPGSALQSGLGLIPGASPIVGILEPMLRKVVISELQARGAGAGVKTDPTAPSAVAVPTEALTALNGILKELSGKLPFPLKAS